MLAAYTGFKGQQTMSQISKLVGPELAQILTGKQLGLVMNAINNAYHEGKTSAGAEMIDSNAVYINKLGKVIEWNEVGAEREFVTNIEETSDGVKYKSSSWVKVKDGDLIPNFAQ